MKNFKFLLTLLLTFGMLMSCSDDNDDTAVHPLVGKWIQSEGFGGIEYSYEITFKENSTGTLVVTTTVDGETETETENFTWSTEGNELTLIGGGETEFIVYSISGNKLTIDFDSDGVNDLVLTRV